MFNVIKRIEMSMQRLILAAAESTATLTKNFAVKHTTLCKRQQRGATHTSSHLTSHHFTPLPWHAESLPSRTIVIRTRIYGLVLGLQILSTRCMSVVWSERY